MTTPAADYHDRAAWLEARKTGVGGSDAGAILGVDPFSTALQIYHEKIAPPGEDPEPNLDMLRGRLYEPIAVDLFAEVTGTALRRQPMRRHKGHPYMVVSMDRQIIKDERGPGYLEAKCPNPQVFRQLKDHGLPERFILQMQHGLEVTGYGWGTFVVYDCVRPNVLHFEVERDKELGGFLVEHEGIFWQHVQDRKPPSTNPVALPQIARLGGQVVQRTDMEWAEAARDLYEARRLKAMSDTLNAGAADNMKVLMGEYGIFKGGGVKIHWKEYEGRKSFDKKALAKIGAIDPVTLELLLTNFPDVAQYLRDRAAELQLDLTQFEKQGKPYAKFTPYFDFDDGDEVPPLQLEKGDSAEKEGA